MSLASIQKTPYPKVDVVYVLHFYNLLHNWLQWPNNHEITP